jgi:hypothetical protein
MRVFEASKVFIFLPHPISVEGRQVDRAQCRRDTRATLYEGATSLRQALYTRIHRSQEDVCRASARAQPSDAQRDRAEWRERLPCVDAGTRFGRIGGV